ncbi:LysR family transcriptional regulator [Ferrimonas sp. SCSIO 43195]|uniref:LysR family transcriptional regulator n=1 Tax=Ferrimonas sp. SCSIO 43195 TaxID=2822844 RepID=UPI002074E6DE|nr:LysR family transcriptional regulator [Ferrimonas sp. SCSIO 43195]USD36597.1 LysR family transcriptional regulator [Ferrimonas sp. SCSIO 43195]
MYTLEQLRMFVAAAEQGSFSAAARKLGKAQSVVSQGIANLEIDLNLTLFDRQGRSPVLTKEGRVLFEQTQMLMLHHQRLQSSALSLSAGEESHLVLALDEVLMMPGLESILVEFTRQFGSTSLEFLTVASPDVVSLVDQGRAHLGLMFSQIPYPAELDASYIGSLPFQAVVSPDHPLVGESNLTLSCLSGHRQLQVRGTQGKPLVDFPVVSQDCWGSNNFYMTAELACRGFGWGYVPSHLVQDPAFSQRLVALNMPSDSQQWQVPVDLVTRPEAGFGPALQWLSLSLKGLLVAGGASER